MVKTNYAKAYTEVLEIIKHFPKEEYEKIPVEKIEFYKKNMDKNYNFTIDPNTDLEKQNISEEANAIIINLFIDYFASEEQKNKINKILASNQKKLEEENQEKYNYNNLFKNKYNTNTQESNNTELVEYKESFFTKFKNFILKIFNF